MPRRFAYTIKLSNIAAQHLQMKKYRLSSKMKVYGFILGGLFLILLYPLGLFIVHSPNGDMERMKSIIVISFFELVLVVLIIAISRFKNIRFDDKLLYVGPRDIPKEIPLENISELKLIMEGVGLGLWKITYTGQDGVKDSVRLTPNANLELFKTKIKEKNQQVTIST